MVARPFPNLEILEVIFKIKAKTYLKNNNKSYSMSNL